MTSHTFFVSVFFIIIILQILASEAASQEMVYVLAPSPNPPINTSSGVSGSLQCTKNSDESYAVCASGSNTAVKYNLQPFSFAAKGPNQGIYMRSCDLYETSSQSTSRAVCAKTGSAGVVYFHRVTDMINVTNVTIGIANSYSKVVVDTPNQVAFVSNSDNPPAICKITNIGSSVPNFAATLSTFGSGDSTPAAMLIIDGFLYVHFYMIPSRLARINISTFTWSKTVNFTGGEYYGLYDNLASDDNFIYDLTVNGILVRCTYKNNNFARFGSLNTGFSNTYSLAISPDLSFLLLTADTAGITLVNTSSFAVDSRALLPNPTSAGYVAALGRPNILSKNNNTYPVLAFSSNNDNLYTFNVSHVPFREAFPTIYPLPSSPINTSSGVLGSVQCTKNSDESYAVCASVSNTAIKYNLQPFSFAAKGPNQGNYMYSCDLYETASQSTSRAVCSKGTNPASNGLIYFHRVSDMINITNVTIGISGQFSHVIVDTPNQVAYISNYNNPPAIYKITNIGSPTPIVAVTLSSFGFGDLYPAAMLIIDGFLYAHFFMFPARLARINISTFTWTSTVIFAASEDFGHVDNLAKDDNFIYDLTNSGILVRCTYKNNNFARFDSLNTGFSNTYSLVISSDQRTLFVASYGSSLLQLIDTMSFSMFGNVVTVLSLIGIITSSCNVYALSSASELVYAFRLNSSSCRTPSATVSPAMSQTNSASTQRTMTSTNSAQNSASISTSISPMVSTSTSASASTSTSTSNSTSMSPKFLPSRSTSTSTSISSSNSETISANKTTSISVDTQSNTADELSTRKSSKRSLSSSRDATSSVTPTQTQSFEPTATKTATNSSNKTSQSRTVTAMATSTATTTQTRAVEIRVPPQPVKVSPTTAGITTAVVVVTSLIANPALGPPMVRNGLILLGGSCGEDVGPLDAATSPLGLEIGNDNYKYWNGAVIGDFIIIMTSFPVLLLISVVYIKIFKKDRPWNEYIVGVRTITGTFFLVLSGPIIVGFMASISFSNAGAETLGVLILGLTTLAATVLWPLHILRRAHKEMQLEVLNEGDHDDLELTILNPQPVPEPKEKKEPSVLKRIHEFLFDSRTGAEWTPLLHELKVGWAYLFNHSASLTYVAIEVICGTGINVTLGLMQDPEATDYSCRVRALMNLMLHVPPTAFLLFANPLLSRFDVVVTTAMWIGNMFTSLMLVLKLFDLGLPIDDTLSVVGLILAVLNLVATLALAMDAWKMIRLLQEKQKSYSYLEGNMIMNNNIDSDLDELLLHDVGAFVNPRSNDNNNNFNNSNNDVFREGVNQEMVNQIPVFSDDDALTNGEQHNMQSSARPGFDEDYLAVLEKLVTSVKNEKGINNNNNNNNNNTASPVE